MADKYDVAVKIVSQKGSCAAKHNVGDEWLIKSADAWFGRKGQTTEGMCFFAFHALFPVSQVLLFGGVLPWEKDPDVTRVACPDPDNPVVFELRRLR